MANFFSMDGPFVKYGSLLFDIIMISAVWALLGGVLPAMMLLSSGFMASLPVGVSLLLLYICLLHWCPATCASIYTLGKKQRGTDTYTMRDFWHAYKTNYKQCMILSFGLTTIMMVVVYNLWLILNNGESFGASSYVLLPLEGLVGLEVLFISLVVSGLVARFEMKTRDFVKYGFLIANKHLLTTILLAILFLAAIYVCIFVNFGLMFVVPGLYMYIAAALLERAFKNYMPSEDEQIENEELEGFSLDAERQAIIDRFNHQTKFDEQGEYSYVKVDDSGNEVVEKDDYSYVVVDKDKE